MQKLARLAIQRRWLVIGAWLAFIVLAQGISGALGGANYKDTFSLPHTETASVAKVLKNAGLDSQNGATGTVVLKAKTGTLQSAPAGLAPALDKLCTSGNQVSTIRTPWQAIDCTKAGAAAGDRSC
jgi:RND superfamily putative drug exporter